MKLLAGLLLLLTGLFVSGTGLYLFVTKAKLNVQSGAGYASIGLLITGLLVIGFAGSVWRSGGGWHVGSRRYHRWGSLGQDE